MRGRCSRNLLIAVAGVLLAHEFERVLEGGDDRLDRVLDLAPLEPEPVNLALDVLVAGLGLLEDEAGARLGVLDDRGGLLVRVVADLVGQALGGHQRVPEVALVLAVLVHEALEPRHVLAQPFASRMASA